MHTFYQKYNEPGFHFTVFFFHTLDFKGLKEFFLPIWEFNQLKMETQQTTDAPL